MQLYKMTAPNGELLMIAPMTTIRKALKLADEAIDRIEDETKTGGVCEMFDNRGRSMFALQHSKVLISRTGY